MGVPASIHTSAVCPYNAWQQSDFISIVEGM